MVKKYPVKSWQSHKPFSVPVQQTVPLTIQHINEHFKIDLSNLVFCTHLTFRNGCKDCWNLGMKCQPCLLNTHVRGQ